MKKSILTVATLLLTVQHLYLLAFGMKEGLSVSTLLFMLPLTAALLLLFVAHRFLRLGSQRKEEVALALIAVLIVVMGEVFLPVSPLKTSYVSHMTQQSVDGIVVTNISDRVFLTASGSPIAVEVTYRTEVQKTGAYGIYPTAFVPTDGSMEPYAVQLSTMAALETTPKPVSNEDGTRTYAQGTTYGTTLVMKPNFVQYDDYTGTFCINIDATLSAQFTREAFDAWMENNMPKQYRFEVTASGNSYFTQGKSVPHTTAGTYAIRDFYNTAISELAPCDTISK